MMPSSCFHCAKKRPDDSTDEGESGGDADANDPNEPIVTPEPGGDDALYAVVTTVSGSLNLRRDALPGSPVLARIVFRCL